MENSIFLKNIERGLEKGLIEYSEDKKKIIYKGIGKDKNDKSYNIANPEEQIRASVFVELVLDYLYPVELINLEVKAPNRVPSYLADIVIFSDNENKQPYIVIEVKKEGISESELKQAIEQTFSYSSVLQAKFCMLVAGTTKIAYDTRKSKVFERFKNKISDIPKNKDAEPPKYVYLKVENVGESRLRAWGGGCWAGNFRERRFNKCIEKMPRYYLAGWKVKT